MDKLPPELLHRVCSSLDVYPHQVLEHRSVLIDIMLSNKALFHAARPKLYRHVRMGPRTFSKMTRILVEKQEVADLVRVLELRLDTSEDVAYPDPLRDSMLAAISRSHLSESLGEDIFSEIHAGTLDALVCVLLSVCRKLTRVHTYIGGRSAPVLRLFEESRLRKGRGSLEQLRALEIGFPFIPTPGAQSSDFVTSLADVFRLWKHPSLRSFECHSVDDVGDADAADLGAIDLRHLAFTHVLFGCVALEKILVACPRATYLHLNLDSGRGAWLEPELGSLGAVLRRRGGRFERLEIFIGWRRNVWDFVPGGTVLGDLTGLTNLRILHSTWMVLFGPRDSAVSAAVLRKPTYLVDTLPRSLQQFVLHMDSHFSGQGEYFEAQLVNLMESESFEQLSLIVIRSRKTFNRRLPRGWESSADRENVDIDRTETGGIFDHRIWTMGCLVLERDLDKIPNLALGQQQ